MARKATDLLDVFRFSDDDDDERERATSREARRPAKKAPRAKRPRKRFEGFALNRRQVWLASSAVGLLLLLSFFLGLAAGQPDGAGAGDALERRASRRVAIRARLPVVDPATRKPVEGERLARKLAKDYDINPRNLRVRRRGSELILDIGPFPSRGDAQRWLEGSGLQLEYIHMEDPFRFPEFVPIP